MNDFWLDDPEWDELRRRSEGQRPRKQRPQKKPRAPKLKTDKAIPKKVQVSVDLTLPRIPKLKKPSLPKLAKKYVLLTGCIISLLVVSGVLYSVFVIEKDNNTTNGEGVLGSTDLKPAFDTLLPDSTEITPEKVKFDSTKGVANYIDKIGTATVTVSQQLLPDAFKDDADAKTEELARSFNATEVIANSSPKAYIGTSSQGPQTVIFHKKDRLIFILSDRELDKNDLAEYITKLK